MRELAAPGSDWNGTMIQRLLSALLLIAWTLPAAPKLVVISIDGLDHRWLRDADKLGVKIPNLRKLESRSARADGVIGIVPTVTWPSHTTIITGVSAPEHGIISNNQPDKPAERWWYASFLKTKTLWHLAREKGMKTGAVWWPVTAGGEIDYNFPEFWKDGNLHPRAMDPVLEQATPGLADRVAAHFPSFRRSIFSDREMVLAARYILEVEKPELFLFHLGELDSEQHETGAFSVNAKATLEYQDELLGPLLDALPADTYVALVSDHGFDTDDRALRPQAMLNDAGIKAAADVSNGVIAVDSDEAARFFRAKIGQPDSVIAREVPMEEVRRFSPPMGKYTAVFEPVNGVMARRGTDGPAIGPGSGGGNHGLWPTRHDYGATFMLRGPGIKHKLIPTISMLEIGPTLAEILGVKLPNAKEKSLLSRLK